MNKLKNKGKIGKIKKIKKVKNLNIKSNKE